MQPRRGQIGLAAVIAGAAGALVTYVGAAAYTNSSECDGPCFGTWPMTYLPIAVGVGCALTAAWIAWERVTRRPGDGIDK